MSKLKNKKHIENGLHYTWVFLFYFILCYRNSRDTKWDKAGHHCHTMLQEVLFEWGNLARMPAFASLSH